MRLKIKIKVGFGLLEISFENWNLWLLVILNMI